MTVTARMAAMGILTTLVVMLSLLVVSEVGMGVSAASTTNTTHPDTHHNTTNLLGYLTLLYKGTYVLYGNGRRSERDLPECASNQIEACNLVHFRFWLTNITERLCRCPDRLECPLDYTFLNDSQAQHVSNRAQLQFCGSYMGNLPTCKDGDVALSVSTVERKSLPYQNSQEAEGQDTHTILACRCPWPNAWIRHNIVQPTPMNTMTTYKCSTLPKCRTGDECGYIRQDTLASYYTCSCPENHLCVFDRPQTPRITSQLHFYGLAYMGTCTLN